MNDQFTCRTFVATSLSWEGLELERVIPFQE